jgi:rhodanese-related sulfurtransferase
MSQLDFDRWLKNLNLSYWGTGQHKLTPAQFFDRQRTEGAVLLDVRTPEEIGYLTLPFALQIPVRDLPERWGEVPADRLVATFCSSMTRAVVAWVFLQLQGLENVRILDAGYDDFTAELMPGKVYGRIQKNGTGSDGSSR